MTALLRPAYALTFGGPAGGGKVVDTTSDPAASTVTELVVELGMAGAADRVRVVMGRLGSLAPAVGQRLDVALGYTEGSTPQQVCTATIVAADPDPRSRRLVAHGSGHALLHTSVDRTFEGATAGAIVTELAAAAGVEVATAEDGISFPAYVVDGRRSAYRHVTDLAELCGFDAYTDHEGKLVFAFFGGGRTTHVFEHAEHIIDLRMRRRAPRATQVVVVGESGTARGENSWAWFAADVAPVTGTAGTGTGRLLLERSVLRTGQAAGQAAQAALTAARRQAVVGEVLVTGAPQVGLGDTVRMAGTPDDDGTYQVRSVTHRLDKVTGFTTAVRFRSVQT